jgi:hypothetical protein
MASSIKKINKCYTDNESIKLNDSSKSIKSDKILFQNNFSELNDNLDNFCYIESENNIIIDHYFFKQYIKNKPEYKDSLNTLNHMINKIENVLLNYDSFNVHLKIRSLTLIEIDKHKDLISMMSIILKQRFPDKLNSCLIYDAPFIFSSLFSLISSFIDKETQKKIQLIK